MSNEGKVDAPAVPQGEAWGYVDHRGCAIKFKNDRHRSELANAIECGGLEYLHTSPAAKLGNDIESALESLVERCNNDAGMSNEDAVIHAEAVLERVYNSRSATPAPAPAQEFNKSVADADIKALYVESQGSDKGWLGIEGSYFIGGVVAARRQKKAPAPAQEVGLTDEEIEAIAKKHMSTVGDHWCNEDAIRERHAEDFARAIISALRAKGGKHV